MNADTIMPAIEEWFGSPSVELSVGGLAGTGKTHMVRQIPLRFPDRRIHTCAFTGKAASLIPRATTIHSLAYIYDGNTKAGEPKFQLRDKLADTPWLIVVDEASMVGPELAHALRSFGVPLIWVGDHGQLPPVDGNGASPSPVHEPDLILTEQHRTALDSPVIPYAMHLREGGDPLDPLPGITVGMERSLIAETIKAPLMEAGKQKVLVAFNSLRVNLNNTIRQHVLRRPSTDPVPGDLILCLRNTKDFFNGEELIVERNLGPQVIARRAHHELVVTRINGPGHPRTIMAPVDQFGHTRGFVPGCEEATHCDWAYAMTVHKAQGSEWDSVIVVESPCDLWEMPRWRYTAATRTRKDLTYVVPR